MMATARDRAYWHRRRVVVVGAGVSGMGAAELLHDLGARVTVNDARDEHTITAAGALAERGIALRAGSHPADLWDDAEVAVFSPGIRPDAPVSRAARAAGVAIVAEIEVAAELIEAPIIAITGSNGKSTVASMVGAIFAQAGLEAPVCGNIGTALSSAARGEIVDGRATDAYIVEVSSFQAHRVDRFHPRLATILNIQPDHLDWHGSLNAYVDAKLRLLRNMGAGDTVVYNADDARLRQRLGAAGGATMVPFGSGSPRHAPAASVGDGALWWTTPNGEQRKIMDVDRLGVIGVHNQANAGAAAALTATFGIGSDAIAAGLAGYRALEHRMEPCGGSNGVQCINDSKATNVDATLAALSGFASGVWLILGGRDKDADFARLLPVLDRRVAAILLIGEASDSIAAALEPTHAVQRCETLENAVARALGCAASGDTVLLSPACTSFDQYPDFEARGRHFKNLAGTAAAARDIAPTPTEDC